MKKRNSRSLTLSVLLLIFISLIISACDSEASKTGSASQDPEIPEFTTETGWVIDTTGELDSDTEERLEAEAQALADDGFETVITIFKDCNGCDQVLIGTDIINENGIGDKEKETGIAITIFLDQEGNDGNAPYIAISTGYGTESVLNDSKAGRVIRAVFAPKRAEGEWQEGLVDVTVAIHQIVSGEKTAEDFKEEDSGLSLLEIVIIFIIIIVVFMVLAYFSDGTSSGGGSGSFISSVASTAVSTAVRIGSGGRAGGGGSGG